MASKLAGWNVLALAMMGVYEQRDMAMAADLFAWVYRR